MLRFGVLLVLLREYPYSCSQANQSTDIDVQAGTLTPKYYLHLSLGPERSVSQCVGTTPINVFQSHPGRIFLDEDGAEVPARPP